MIRELEHTAPQHLRFVQDKLSAVETTLKKFTPIFIVSSITGSAETVVGVATCIYALATAAFYKMRLYIPFISQQTKTLWTYTNPEDSKTRVGYSLELAIDSIKMVAMGTLKAIPGIGNITAASIYKLAEKQGSTEKALRAEKKAHEETKAVFSGVDPETIQKLRGELHSAHEELEGVKASLAQKSADLTLLQQVEQKDRAEITARIDEINQLQAKIEENGSALASSQQTIEQRGSELAFAQRRVRDLEQLLGRGDSQVEQLRQAREKLAQVEAECKAEHDKVTRLRSENKNLKQKVSALEASAIPQVSEPSEEVSTSRHSRRKHRK